MFSTSTFTMIQEYIQIENPTIFKLDKFLVNLKEIELQEINYLHKPSVEKAMRLLKNCKESNEFIVKLSNSIQTHEVDWEMLGREISYEDMLRYGEIGNDKFLSRVPKVTFGYLNYIWLKMEHECRNGSKFFEYSSFNRNACKNLAGESGYCLVRENTILFTMTTMLS